MAASGLRSMVVGHRETDLWLGVDAKAYCPALEEAARHHAVTLYSQLETYIAADPVFGQTLEPYTPAPGCPPVARLMAAAASLAGVGPMAAVAGAFCGEIARRLEAAFPITDLIIENGGDLYIRSTTARQIAIYAGASPLSGRVAVETPSSAAPLGICTSSGTVGHSLSFGKADAVTVLAAAPAVADAYATAIGNMVTGPDAIAGALDYSAGQPEIIGVVIIAGDRIGCRGDIKLTGLS